MHKKITPIKAVIALAVFFALLWTGTAILLHSNFHTLYELGYFEQALYNTVQGDFFDTVSDNGNKFASHNQPILFFYLPLYFLFQHPMTLSLLNNLIIALGALPVFLLARRVLKNNVLAFVFSLSYLLFPSFYYSNLRAFYPIMMSVTFLLFSFYFMDKKNWKWMYIFLGLTIITQEAISITLICIGLYLMYKKQVKHGLIVISFSILWFFISVKLVIASFFTKGQYAYYTNLYEHLGDSTFEIIKTIITRPFYVFGLGDPTAKIQYLLALFRHNIFLGLFFPEILLIGGPIIVQNVVSQSAFKYSILAHYSYPLIAIIFVSSIYGLKRFLEMTKNKGKAILAPLLIILAVFSCVSYGIIPMLKDNCNITGFFSGNCPENDDIIGDSPPANYPFIRTALSMIPDDASAMAQNHIFSHLTTRKETYSYEQFYHCSSAEYFIFDVQGTLYPLHPGKEVEKYLEEQVPALGYSEIYHQKNIHLFKRTGEMVSCAKK